MIGPAPDGAAVTWMVGCTEESAGATLQVPLASSGNRASVTVPSATSVPLSVQAESAFDAGQLSVSRPDC